MLDHDDDDDDVVDAAHCIILIETHSGHLGTSSLSLFLVVPHPVSDQSFQYRTLIVLVDLHKHTNTYKHTQTH